MGALLALASLALTAPAGAHPAARRGGVARQGPLAQLTSRYTSLPMSGSGGDTYAWGLMVFPLRSVARVRALRWGVGVEGGVRPNFAGRADVLVQAVTSVGWQHPGRVACPYLAALFGAGVAWPQGAPRNDTQPVTTAGAEVGVDWRFGRVTGVGVALGLGRVREGDVAHDSAWVRVAVSLF